MGKAACRFQFAAEIPNCFKVCVHYIKDGVGCGFVDFRKTGKYNKHRGDIAYSQPRFPLTQTMFSRSIYINNWR